MAALVLVLVALGGLEVFWRRLGFEPGPVDDEPITWVELRRAADRHGRRSVALIGTSRSRRGLDPRIVESELPQGERVFQLAIWGANPEPVFADMARDRAFTGVVVYGVLPTHLFAPRRAAIERGEDYVRLFEDPSPAAVSEAYLLRALRRHVVALRQSTALLDALRGWVTRRVLPQPPYLRQRPDRGYARPDPAVYGATRVERLRRAALARASGFVREWTSALPPPEPMPVIDARLDRMAREREAIEARGGRVLFVRLPSCGTTREREASLYPRSRYYDRAVERVGGAWLHFADEPVMAHARCIDGSHMDHASGDAASRAVGAWIARMLAQPPGATSLPSRSELEDNADEPGARH